MLEHFLKAYLRERPFFLSLIRAKEAHLYQKYLPLKKPVLDFGCGDGFFANVAFGHHGLSRIDSKFSQMIDVGIDIKDSRIEEARAVRVYKKIVIYDGKRIPFDDGFFATVVSNSVLEHVDNLEMVLSEIHRVLKPNGLFLTTVMAKPWEMHLFGVRIFGNIYRKWMRKKQVHNYLLTRSEWDDFFRKAGFKIKETIGHLTPKACALIDVSHYLSLDSLLWRKLFGRWVMFPFIAVRLYPIGFLSRILIANAEPEKSGALFYVLEKSR